MIDVATLSADLTVAEEELYAWATGQRSFTNQMMDSENWVGDSSSTGPGLGPDRQQTLVRIAERDAAEMRIAREKVLALRLLVSGEGL